MRNIVDLDELPQLGSVRLEFHKSICEIRLNCRIKMWTATDLPRIQMFVL